MSFSAPLPSDPAKNNTGIAAQAGSSALKELEPAYSSARGFKLYGKQLVGLDKLLSPGEKMLAVAGGMMRTHVAGADTARAAVCVATDRRCIFYNRRMFGQYDFEDFAYDRITSVQVRKGLAWGAVDIYVAQVKKELYLTNNDCAEALSIAVREKIHYQVPLTEATTASVPSVVVQPAPPTLDLASQIRDLAHLVQEGHLTQVEFERMKQELINKLSR